MLKYLEAKYKVSDRMCNLISLLSVSIQILTQHVTLEKAVEVCRGRNQILANIVVSCLCAVAISLLIMSSHSAQDQLQALRDQLHPHQPPLRDEVQPGQERDARHVHRHRHRP